MGGYPGGSGVKNLPVNAEDTGNVGSVPRWEGSPRRGNGNPLQYSCLENSMDIEAWQAKIHGVAELVVIKHTHMHSFML